MILIAENKLFDRLILLCICVNCIFLALDDQPPVGSAKATMFWWSELVFNILYTLECCIKIIAWGLLYAGANSYLRSPWNVLDSVVVTNAA